MNPTETGESMTAGDDGRLIRRRGTRPQVTFVELFFDLVFIFALTRLSQGLLEHLAWIDVFETLVVLPTIWWLWTLTVWQTDTLDPAHPAVQFLVIGAMFGGLVASAAAPEAFHQRGLVFAVAYVATRVGTGLYALIALRGYHARRIVLRGLFWACLSAVPWLVGAVNTDTVRWVLWGLALLTEYLGSILRWPAPLIGRVPSRDWYLAGEHVAERYRQFIIIGLGETILVMGMAFASTDFEPRFIAALVISFATTVLLWRIYIYRAGELLAAAISRSGSPGRAGQAASLDHLLLVAGIVVTAVGDELVIGRPFGDTPPSWTAALLGGPALFLAGRAVLDRTVFGHISWSRMIGVLALAAIAPVTLGLPPLLTALAATLVLLGVAISNQITWRTHPATMRPRRSA